MALMRWHERSWPRELGELREEMDKLFERTFSRRVPERRAVPVVRGWAPAVDMFERANEVVVRIEVPGMSKEEIDISVMENTLTIFGERKAEEEIKDDDYYCCERFYGKFRRDIMLPQGVDTENIRASCKSGILEVVLPKKQKAKPQKIEVAVE